METIISDRIYIKNASQKVWLWCKDNLVLNNPTYLQLKKMGKEDTIRWKHVPEKINLFIEDGFDLIIPFGCLRTIWPLIKESKYYTSFNQAGSISYPLEKITQPLRDYQEKAVNYMVKASGGVLIGPCSSGKTNCGIEIVHRIGKKFLWVAHTLDLVKQSRDRMKKLYPNMDVGLITEGKIQFGKDGTCATIQTLGLIDPEIYKNKFDVVIVDECHHCVTDAKHMKMFAKVIEKIPARYKYGITATGKRSDSLTPAIYAILGANSNSLAPTYTIDRSEIPVMTAEHKRIDLDTPMDYSFLNEDGTYNYVELVNYLSENEKRNKFIVDLVCSHNKEIRKQLVLCSRVSHCEKLYEMLVKEGIKAVLLVGKVTPKKRDEILKEKKEWDVIVATFSLAKEGLDIVCLDTLILAGLMKDEIGVIQSCGRIERISKDKKKPIVLDLVDKNIPYCVGSFKKRERILKRR